MKSNTKRSGSTSKRQKGGFHRLYLVHPLKDADVESIAERIINIKAVEEVFVTDSADGFEIRAKFFDDEEPKDANSCLSKRLGRDFGKVTSYQYTE